MTMCKTVNTSRRVLKMQLLPHHELFVYFSNVFVCETETPKTLHYKGTTIYIILGTNGNQKKQEDSIQEIHYREKDKKQKNKFFTLKMVWPDTCLAPRDHYSEKTGGGRCGFDMERTKCQAAKKLQFLKKINPELP